MKPGMPSIFNDVMGPVMRGPSSSHTAASWRIARQCMELLNDELAAATIEFDREGAWAGNYREQGTALGMDGGLLGIDITDEQIMHPERLASERGIHISYKVSSFETDHANTVRISLEGKRGKSLCAMAVSTGGGMFEIRKLEGHPVDIRGDLYHLFAACPVDFSLEMEKTLRESLPGNAQITLRDGGLLVSLPDRVPEDGLKQLRALIGTGEIRSVSPVLPITSGKEREYPFRKVEEMLELAAEDRGPEKSSLGRLGLEYEASRSGLPEGELMKRMGKIVRIVEQGIATGLSGTEYEDRILPRQSHLIGKAARAGSTGADPLVNGIIANITALMEAKSALQLIVAIPTAGSCGTFGGTVKAYCDAHDMGEEQKILAYFAGGLMGVFFAQGPGFSAEEYGCQVETGAAACMAAAALADLGGGNALQAERAASMALQNSIGLVCDPVADRVEVPCLGRNVNAGLNALGASTMALAGFDAVVPFSQVLEAVTEAGKSLSPGLRCTGLGGLSVTDASRNLKRALEK